MDPSSIAGLVSGLAGPTFDFIKTLNKKGMTQQIELANAQARTAEATALSTSGTVDKFDPKMIGIGVAVLFVIILIMYFLSKKS